jgi:YhcN/YlaJ family sporulation lipoprotein
MRDHLIRSCSLLLAAAFLTGCASQADPARRETNETRTDKGMNVYSGYTPPADDRQVVTDVRDSQKGNTTRSAHAIAYELESMPHVKAASVLVVGRDAFVGVNSPPDYELTNDVKSTIRSKIAYIDRTIERIYITNEPQAVKYLSGYTDALEQGRPLDGYERQFKSVLANTWPTGP